MPATGVLASNGTLPMTQPLKLKPALNGHTAANTSDQLQIIDNEKQFTFVYCYFFFSFTWFVYVARLRSSP